MSAYKTRDQRVADEFSEQYGRCYKCGITTPNETLAELAQCRPCFDAYCAEGNVPNPPRTAQERREVLKRMAGGITAHGAATVVQRLREIEASGRTLTDSQRWVLACCEKKLGLSA